ARWRPRLRERRSPARRSAATPHLAAPPSAPAGRGARASQCGGLAGDLRALLDPLVELVEAGRGGGGIRSLGRQPALEGGEELRGQSAIGRVEIEVGLLRVGDAIEPEIGLAPILDRIGVAGLEGERLLVGRERRVVVAELAVAVADVVPRLGERVVELHRLLEPGKRLPIEVKRFAPGLVLLAGIARLLGVALSLVRLLHVAHAVVVGVARLLLRRLLARRGHRLRHGHAAAPVGPRDRDRGHEQTEREHLKHGAHGTSGSLPGVPRRGAYAATARGERQPAWALRRRGDTVPRNGRTRRPPPRRRPRRSPHQRLRSSRSFRNTVRASGRSPISGNASRSRAMTFGFWSRKKVLMRFSSPRVVTLAAAGSCRRASSSHRAASSLPGSRSRVNSRLRARYSWPG